MRLIPSTALILAALCLVCARAAAQIPQERMRECGDPGHPDIQLVGVVTDAATGEPLDEAIITFEEYLAGLSSESGCYVARPEGGVPAPAPARDRAGAPLPVRRHRAGAVAGAHRHGALCAAPHRAGVLPAGRRVVAADDARRRVAEAGGRGVDGAGGDVCLQRRLPPVRDVGGIDTLLVEHGRFQMDGLAQDVEVDDVASPRPVTPRDYWKHAAGEVFAGDSVAVQLVPLLTHGGITLVGRIRGDSIHGRWMEHEPLGMVGGRFVMHRVPASPLGDSLVAQGIRAAARAREAEAERRLRVGTLRLRVVDARAGGYARVGIWVQREGGGEDDPANTFVHTSADGDGWSDPEELEPGRYELFIHQYECGGRLHIPNEELEENQRPRGKVVIRSRQPAEQELRVDLCAIQGYDMDMDPPGLDDEPATPAKP